MPVPEPIELPDRGGKTVERLTIGGCKGVAVRLFKYLEGELLERIPFDPAILFRLGVETAKLTVALSVSSKHCVVQNLTPR